MEEEMVGVKMNRLEMENLNAYYTIPAKMAMALFEILFSRETLASSAKHNK